VNKGRVRDAFSMLKEALPICRELGDQPIAVILCRTALALAIGGRAETAARLLSCAEALHEEIGASVRRWLANMNDETLTSIGRKLDQAAFAEAWEQGRALTEDKTVRPRP
jgi:hypothetical protein